MSNNTSTTETTSLVCANCGKKGSDVTNTCNKCKSVMYCNAACKKRHRHKHKEDCERRVAELHDETLFKQPPPKEDCPICMIRLPAKDSGAVYVSCCGKLICCGCIHAPRYDEKGNEVDNRKCPFCRAQYPKTNEEMNKRYEKRMGLNDANAIYNRGVDYSLGKYGLPQNHTKAFQLYCRAGDLGSAEAYFCIGKAYRVGEGVERDDERAKYYYELAAMGGNSQARHNLGFMEEEAGNMDRAIKHYMIAVGDGFNISLNFMRDLIKIRQATKDDYTAALQSYQSYLAEIKSDQRDKAAAAHDQCKYY